MNHPNPGIIAPGVSPRQPSSFLFLVSRIKRFLLRRSTVLTVMLMNILTVAVSVVIPQRTRMPEAVGMARNEISPEQFPVLHSLGLDHILTTPWFAGILGLLLLCLLLSLPGQIRKAWNRTVRHGEETAEGRGGDCLPARSGDALRPGLRNHGLGRITEGNQCWRYYRYRWSWWGNPILHLGLVVIVAVSLGTALTGQRGVLRLIPGETHRAGDGWFAEEHGAVVGPLFLPGTVTLDYLLPEFWPGGELRRLSSGLRWGTTADSANRVTLDVSVPLTIMGLRWYHGTDFGHAFWLTVTLPNGDHRKTRLDLPYPERRGKAGYGNFRVDGVAYPIKAKYYPGEAGSPGQTAGLRLYLRLGEGQGPVSADCVLGPDRSGMLGQYRVRVDEVRPWTSIVISRQYGIALIFFGFFLVVAGGVLLYVVPPREVLVPLDGQDVRSCFGGCVPPDAVVASMTSFSKSCQDAIDPDLDEQPVSH